MIRAFYTARSSLVSQQLHLDTIANNVANINTTGYKPQQVSFSALMYENINGGAGNSISVGHGVRVGKMGLDFEQGILNQTNMPMDCAILGPGFFAVEDRESGEITFTRDGNFKKSIERNRVYLVNSNGDYVLNDRMRRIEIEEEFDYKEIGVFDFENRYGLQMVGGNRFAATDESGNAERVREPNVKVGFLENSAVQLSKEIVKMIEASKGFSLGSRVIHTTDEMERIINQLR
ncbi:MAG: flagellar hook-basal body protein [Clostridiales bacterium]|nr:flagellar hook-basal body protein [Clostridiales bacterium]